MTNDDIKELARSIKSLATRATAIAKIFEKYRTPGVMTTAGTANHSLGQVAVFRARRRGCDRDAALRTEKGRWRPSPGICRSRNGALMRRR
jgi:hypothetical protein